MTQYLTTRQLESQAWKLYFVAMAWPIYVLVLPVAWSKLGMYALLFIIFPGTCLFTWMACLMHECWHKYVPNVPNRFFYQLFSYMLVTDPQLYRLVHGHHHSKVNTWDDTEFHPLGRIKNTFLRRVYNFCEILFGVALTFSIQMNVLPRHPRYKDKYKTGKAAGSVIMWLVIYACLIYASSSLFGVAASDIALSYTINFWLCSVMIHHVQLVPHGNLIVEGDWNVRNMKSRNLKNDTLPQKLFHFLTHGDTREHVLHHTHVAEHARPFPGKVPLPTDAVYISLHDYAHVLWDMVIKG